MIKIPGASVVRAYFKAGLHDLIFSVTGRCDSRCTMCYYWKTIGQNDKDKELTIREIELVAASLGRFYTLFISGGEPTLRDDLPEICSVFRRCNAISHIYLPTNGLQPERTARSIAEIARRCPGSGMTVLLPLEAEAEENDRIRGVPGAFDRVLQSITLIAEIKKTYPNISLQVNTVLSNRNIRRFPELERFVFTNLPVDIHHFSPVRGVPRDAAVAPPDYDQWTKICTEAEQYVRRYFAKQYTGWRYQVFLNSWRNHKRLVGEVLKNNTLPFKCLAGRRIAVLEWDGGVRLCELMPVVGNVRAADYDFNKVLESSAARHALLSTRRCACTHACFLTASLAYDPVQLLKSYVLP